MLGHVSFLVPQTALHGRLAEDVADRLAERLGAVDHEEDPLGGSRPRSTRSESSAVATVAFSVEPSQSPSGILTPSVVIPSVTTLVRPCSSSPSIIITASLMSSRRRLISSPSDRRVRSTNVRETAERDVDRAARSTSEPTGS